MEKFKFIKFVGNAELFIEAASLEKARKILNDLVKDYIYWHYLP